MCVCVWGGGDYGGKVYEVRTSHHIVVFPTDIFRGEGGEGEKALPDRNNLPRIKLVRGKLFQDRYLLPMTAYWVQ